jgi:hypothetical protein
VWSKCSIRMMSCLVPTCVLHFAWFSCIEAPTARNDQEMVATHPLGLPFSWRLQSIKLQLIHFSSNEMQLYYINLYNCINCIVVSTGVAVSHGRRWQPTRPTWIWPCLQQRKGGGLFADSETENMRFTRLLHIASNQFHCAYRWCTTEFRRC